MMGNKKGQSGIYDLGTEIKFKTTMLKSSLCDYSNVYILVKGTITVVGQGQNDAVITADRNNKQVVFKNWAPFTSCISDMNNTQVDNSAKHEVVIPIYSLIEYNKKYEKTSVNYGCTTKIFPVIQ